VKAFDGEVFRALEARRTLRFELGGKMYFIKLHYGVGWYEIIENLLRLRWPVLGASHEYWAIRRCDELGIKTLSVAAFGVRGRNPARQFSFLITDALQDCISLEEYCARWPAQPPDPLFKWRLIEKVAEIAANLHRGGVNHRDFYLCHFLLPQSQTDPHNRSLPDLYLIDLHRAQIRTKVPLRWIVKDLSALYFSALQIGLSRRDVFRFIRIYQRQSFKQAWQQQAEFWQQIEQRAYKLQRRFKRRFNP